MTGAFFDTNILVYAHAQDADKGEVARSLLERGGSIGVQTLNEFVNVARRKLQWDWAKIDLALAGFDAVFDSVVPLDAVVHALGKDMAKRHNFSIYDAMIVAAALTAGCDRLYSEDMHHGLVIDGRLTIENPFPAP
ncbi:PIN domain-containing protein [Sphingomonas sp. RS2018]